MAPVAPLVPTPMRNAHARLRARPAHEFIEFDRLLNVI